MDSAIMTCSTVQAVYDVMTCCDKPALCKALISFATSLCSKITGKRFPPHICVFINAKSPAFPLNMHSFNKKTKDVKATFRVKRF